MRRIHGEGQGVFITGCDTGKSFINKVQNENNKNNKTDGAILMLHWFDRNLYIFNS